MAKNESYQKPPNISFIFLRRGNCIQITTSQSAFSKFGNCKICGLPRISQSASQKSNCQVNTAPSHHRQGFYIVCKNKNTLPCHGGGGKSVRKETLERLKMVFLFYILQKQQLNEKKMTPSLKVELLMQYLLHTKERITI